MKKRILSVALVVAMLAIVITGGTLAYLNDTDGDKNVMVAGNVKIEQNEQLRDGSDYVDNVKFIPAVFNNGTKDPGSLYYDCDFTNKDGVTINDKFFDTAIDNEIDKFITVTNNGTEAAYVRTIILYESNPVGNTGLNTDDFVAPVSFLDLAAGDTDEYIGLVTIDNKKFFAVCHTYGQPVAAGKTSAPSLSQMYLVPDTDNAWYDAVGDDHKFEVYAFSQAVQYAGFEDEGATFALDAAFGAVTVDSIPDMFDAANVTMQ